MRRILTALVLLAGSLLPAAAQDRAVALLIAAAGDPAEFGSVALDTALANRLLTRQGIEVIAALNPDADEIDGAVRRFALEAEGAEHVTVVILGRFVTTGPDAWLLPSGAEAPRSLAGLSGAPYGASALRALVAGAPEGVLILGHDGRTGEVAPYLDAGTGRPHPSAGPAVHVDADAVLPMLRAALSRTDGRLTRREVLDADGDARAALPRDGVALRAPRDDRAARERAAWEAARRADTVESYRAFLADWRGGRFAADARTRIRAIETDPERVEAALGLTPQQRRRVQQNLQTVGHDPRGVDGVFGPGTRAAIRAWQRGRGVAPTGFLDRTQVEALANAAARERDRLLSRDDALWNSTPRTAQGYRRYLEVFPDGRHAEDARAALAALEVDEDDRRAWENVSRIDTVAAYLNYIARFPDGFRIDEARTREARLSRAANLSANERSAFLTASRTNTAAGWRDFIARFPASSLREPALARLRLLVGDGQPAATAPAPAGQAGLERAEEALGLDALTRRLIEIRLEQMGFDPGTADGRFDADTRRAIRGWQAQRGERQTGYLAAQDIVSAILQSLR